MKYLIYILQVFEIFWLTGFFWGGEYPEGPLVPLVTSSIIFILFLALMKYYRQNRKVAKVLIVITLLVSLVALVFMFISGSQYFSENWKGMTLSQYRNMVIFAMVITVYQVIKLCLINKKAVKKLPLSSYIHNIKT